MENERRNRLEVDKKAGEEKKKAEEKAAKELHEAKVQAVMQAAAAGSPKFSQEDSAHIFCSTCRGVPANVLILRPRAKRSRVLHASAKRRSADTCIW